MLMVFVLTQGMEFGRPFRQHMWLSLRPCHHETFLSHLCPHAVAAEKQARGLVNDSTHEYIHINTYSYIPYH